MPSVTSRLIKAPPSDVWAVLSDGWLYGLWVVGASRIREVDDDWPAEGSKIHHSVGSWPLLIDDNTEVTEAYPLRELLLRARAWPGGEAAVRISIEEQGAECLVTITEEAVKGPGALIPGPVQNAVLHWRNKETLERLAFIVERRPRD